MNRKRYKKSFPEDILSYFRSYLGYWERRLEQVEARMADQAVRERAEKLEKRREEQGGTLEAMREDAAALLDPEYIVQGARTRAYQAVMDEMIAKRRLQGLPTMVKWARRVGVTMTTVREWREQYPDFDEACRECKEIQADILRDGGLSGVYAGKTVTFLLQADHGLRADDSEDNALSRGMVIKVDRLVPKEVTDQHGGETTDD